MPRPYTPLETPPLTPTTIAGVSWWSEQLPPWEQPVGDRPVDVARTSQLGPFNDRVRIKGGVPLQLTGPGKTTVLHQSVPPSWGNWLPSERLPLPNRVWVETHTSDFNWFGIDPNTNTYYEASSLRPLLPWLSSPWAANSIRIYDLKAPWDEQPPSLTGGGLPMWPMVPKIGHLDQGAGGVRHALHFVVSGGYSSDPFVPPARKSDGERTGHPLRAGARLRLREDAADRLFMDSNGKHDDAVIWALRVYGAIVNDRTADVGHNLRLPQDTRLALSVALQLTDFEVIY